MIHKALFFLTLLLTGSLLDAQTDENRNQIGISISASDFSGPITTQYFEFEKYHGLGRLYYSRYLNSSFNAKLDFSAIKALHPKETVYPDIDGGVYTLEDIYDAGLKVEYKLDNGYIFKEEAIVGPYITTGFGANLLGGDQTPEDWNTYIPFGIGFNIRPAKKITINLQAEYKLNIDNSFDYTQYSGGLAYNFGRKKDKDPLVVDTDNDGIPDDSDECPFAYGIIDYFGCPDNDGDGIGDSRDKCPFDAGEIANQGCPILDKDKDGVNDDKDLCPNLAGKATLGGCPDSDNDGVADKDDDCPETAGTIANKGCPEVVAPAAPELTNSFTIYFDGSSSKIKSDQRGVLDNLAKIMSDNGRYEVRIKGHTCSVGGENKNVDLSMQRAENAWNYLVGKGVDGKRMSVYGYGEFEPKYSNSIPNEAVKNRRVDLEIYE